MTTDLKFTIGIPTYNGEPYIGETLRSVLSQSFQNFEIVVSDDCSTDNTLGVVKSFGDERIKVFRNKENLGYGRNLQEMRKHISGDILFLLGQDDILLKDALLKTANAFAMGEEIGAVVRPYYWFYGDDVFRPVRAVRPYDATQDRVISIFDGKKAARKIFEAAGQLSGLAYRVKYLDTNFHEETFPSHIYPLAGITKKHKVVFLKDYTVAVRIISSQTRFKPSIYDVSPTESWVLMFEGVYKEEKFNQVKKMAINQLATNFVGLLQIRNFSTFRNLWREIVVLVKLRPLNLLDPRFYLFALLTLFVPRKILIPLVDNFKTQILSRTLRGIKIDL